MGVAERYLNATVSANLKVDERPRDADALIAAGWVAGGDERKAFVLALHRRLSGDDRGVQGLVSTLAGWAQGRSARRARSSGAAKPTPMPALEAADLAKAVLAWWMNPACETCGGLGHPMIEGTPVLNEAVPCGACGGSGKRDLVAGMTDRQAELARWMVSEIETVAPVVFGDVAARLNRSMSSVFAS
jgi:hypothetical protein